MANPAKRRLGRPPGTDSADTRDRILDVARRSFAERGYETTTNKVLSAEAGITTGAIYHYFDSKLDIYASVHDDVQERVYAQFTEAVDAHDTFVTKFEALLEVAHDLNRQDPSLAQFLGTTRVDRRRHAEVADALGGFDQTRQAFFDRVVEHGVTTGEIAPENVEMVKAFVITVLTGLNDALSDDPERHRRAIDAVRALMGGNLIDAA